MYLGLAVEMGWQLIERECLVFGRHKAGWRVGRILGFIVLIQFNKRKKAETFAKVSTCLKISNSFYFFCTVTYSFFNQALVLDRLPESKGKAIFLRLTSSCNITERSSSLFVLYKLSVKRLSSSGFKFNSVLDKLIK